LYPPALPGGFLGVDIFFVLSGFLITSLLTEEFSRAGSIRLKDFYIRRALRLMPALLALISITALFGLIFLRNPWVKETYQGIWLSLSYVSNWFYAFKYASADNPLGITWSLAIEEQFYLVWPLVLSNLLVCRLRTRWILYYLTLAIVLIALHRKLLWAHEVFVGRLYYASDTRADSLLMGCLVGIIISKGPWLSRESFEPYLKFLAGVGFIFLTYMILTADWRDPMLYQCGGFTLIAIALAVILMVIVLSPPKPVLLILRFTPLVWFGQISYGLYLWHWCLRFFVYGKQSIPPSVTHFVVAVVFSLTVPALSYYFVEKPFLRLKKRFT